MYKRQIVGAMSVMLWAALLSPFLIPQPIKISGICESYEFQTLCVVPVLSLIHIYIIEELPVFVTRDFGMNEIFSFHEKPHFSSGRNFYDGNMNFREFHGVNFGEFSECRKSFHTQFLCYGCLKMLVLSLIHI